MARDLQAPEGDGTFIVDDSAVYPQIAQRPLIELFEPLPVMPSPAPGGDARAEAQQQAPEAAALRAPRREDGVSQEFTSEL
jgi:hypothetical protein